MNTYIRGNGLVVVYGIAKSLLEEDELPIIDIGYECGFNTPSQFIRAFKKTVEKTPSEYRIQKRNSK